MSSTFSDAGDTRVNTTTSNSQYAPAIAKLSDGYVIVWQSLPAGSGGPGQPSDYNIYLQRYASDGTPLGGEVQVNSVAINDQVQATVAATPGGGFAIAWASAQEQGAAGIDYGVYLRAFDANGARLGVETQVNSYTALNQEKPSIAALAGGGYIVTWWSDIQAAEPAGIYSRIVAADGTTAGGELRVNTASAGPQSAPVATGLAGGGYVVAWDGVSGIHAQRFDSHGVALAPEARVDTVEAGAIAKPVAAALAGGGYVIAWQSAAADGSGLDIHVQRFGADGAAIGPQSIVNSTVDGHQTAPAITATADGGYVIAWTSTGQDGSGDGVFAQRFDANGNTVRGETQMNMTTSLNQSDAALAPADGGYIAVWSSQEQDGRSWDVFVRSVHDNVLPPLRSVVDATEGDDTLYGTWDDNACVAGAGDDIYFSQGGSDWFNGGTGLDTFVFPESMARVTSYTLESGTLTVHASDAHNPQTTPIILATERIEFSDALFALDTHGPSGDAPAGHVWQAAALLNLAFGAAPGQSALSQWTAQADAAASMGALGQVIVDTFAPGISSAALVTHLHVSLTGHAPSADVVAGYVNQIGAGKQFATQGDAFAFAASTAINIQEVAGFLGDVQRLDPSWF
jgi:hypothetical protein